MQPIALRIGISELLIILLYALACMNPFSLSCVRFAFGEFRFAFGEFRFAFGEFRFAFGEFRVCVLWGVTRLNGARGKKHVWAPMVEPEVFRKQLHCIEKSTCDIFGTFRRPPAVIRRPHSDSHQGNCARLVPPCYAPVRVRLATSRAQIMCADLISPSRFRAITWRQCIGAFLFCQACVPDVVVLLPCYSRSIFCGC